MSTPYDYYPACLYAIQQLGQGYTLTQACNASMNWSLRFGSFAQYRRNKATVMLAALQACVSV